MESTREVLNADGPATGYDKCVATEALGPLVFAALAVIAVNRAPGADPDVVVFRCVMKVEGRLPLLDQGIALTTSCFTRALALLNLIVRMIKLLVATVDGAHVPRHVWGDLLDTVSSHGPSL